MTERTLLALVLACSGAAGCRSGDTGSASGAPEERVSPTVESRAATARAAPTKGTYELASARGEGQTVRTLVAVSGEAPGQADVDDALARLRDEYTADTRESVVGLVKRRRAAEVRIAQLVDPRTVAEAALRAVVAKEILVHAGIGELSTATAVSLEYVKAKVDRDLLDLLAAVEDLERRAEPSPR